MADKIIFYDLPAIHKGADKPSCFSFNPWKPRMVLNYKQLPYTTEFVEYPDLEPKLKAAGLAPNAPGTGWTDYTSPAIKLPSGQFIMNSANIVPELEKLHPSPSLHLEENIHPQLEEAVMNLSTLVWWDTLAALPKILNPPSAKYFSETRAVTFGASLDDVATAKGRAAGCWEAAAAPGGPAEKLAQLLTKEFKKDEGPFALGSQPSYGDFIVVSIFECVERCLKEDYERLMALDPSFPALHEACRPWVERDD